VTDLQQAVAKAEERACVACGETFRTTNPGTKYCTSLCRRKTEDARWPKRKHGGPSPVDIAPPRKEG
jgi:hypothetical protein